MVGLGGRTEVSQHCKPPGHMCSLVPSDFTHKHKFKDNVIKDFITMSAEQAPQAWGLLLSMDSYLNVTCT